MDLLAALERSTQQSVTASVSNPPYQDSAQDGCNRPSALYHRFDSALMAVSQYQSAIHPARWLTTGAGAGLVPFREEMLASTEMRFYRLYAGSSEVFADAVISGGVAYHLWSRGNTLGLTHVDTTGDVDLWRTLGDHWGVQDHRAVRALRPVTAHLQALPESHYGLGTKDPLRRPIGTVPCHMIERPGVRVRVWVKPPTPLPEAAHGWRVGVAKVAGNKRLGRVFLIKPGEVASKSFLTIPVVSEAAAERCSVYLRTNFVTARVMSLMNGANLSPSSFALVPDANFETGEIRDLPGVFLDFDSPSTLDDQLAEAYNLDSTDRTYMSEVVRPYRAPFEPWGDDVNLYESRLPETHPGRLVQEF